MLRSNYDAIRALALRNRHRIMVRDRYRIMSGLLVRQLLYAPAIGSSAQLALRGYQNPNHILLYFQCNTQLSKAPHPYNLIPIKTLRYIFILFDYICARCDIVI